MKKILILAASAAALATPAFAHDHDGKDWDHKAEKMAKYYITQADTNGDGALSKEEHSAYGDKMFSAADTNRDGKLTLEEKTEAKKSELQKFMDWKKTNYKDDKDKDM